MSKKWALHSTWLLFILQNGMTSFMFALHLFYFSMGCGIGYGYLHRIPIKDPSELPPQLKASPAPDGFSDVS